MSRAPRPWRCSRRERRQRVTGLAQTVRHLPQQAGVLAAVRAMARAAPCRRRVHDRLLQLVADPVVARRAQLALCGLEQPLVLGLVRIVAGEAFAALDGGVGHRRLHVGRHAVVACRAELAHRVGFEPAHQRHFRVVTLAREFVTARAHAALDRRVDDLGLVHVVVARQAGGGLRVRDLRVGLGGACRLRGCRSRRCGLGAPGAGRSRPSQQQHRGREDEDWNTHSGSRKP